MHDKLEEYKPIPHVGAQCNSPAVHEEAMCIETLDMAVV